MILAVDLSRMLLGEADGLDARHGCSSRNICCRPHLAPLILLLFSFFRLHLLHYCLRKRRRPQVSLVLKTNRTVAQDLLISGDLLSPSTASDDPRGRLRQQEHHVRRHPFPAGPTRYALSRSVGETSPSLEQDDISAASGLQATRDASRTSDAKTDA